MNSTLQVIHERRSTRKYADTPITTEEKEAILQAAMRAPTAGNMMLYSIIEVNDQALKEQLAVTCDHQPFIASAPWVLLFVADYQRWMNLFTWSGAPAEALGKGLAPRTPAEGDLLLACCDALIAAQTAVIAAQSLGIGSCYIGDILENAETHRGMFDLPRYTLPITLVCFGHPAFSGEHAGVTRRFDRQYIVFEDRYRQLEPVSLANMLRIEAQRSQPDLSIEEGAKKIARGTYTRKFVSDFSFEMSRSVKEWLAVWTGAEKVD